MLLLVLASAAQVSVDILDDRSKDVVSRLKRGIRVSVGAVCGMYSRFNLADDIQTYHRRTPVTPFRQRHRSVDCFHCLPLEFIALFCPRILLGS